MHSTSSLSLSPAGMDLQGYYVLQSLCSGFWQPDSVGSLSICPDTVVLSHLFSWVDLHFCDTSRSIPMEILCVRYYTDLASCN